MFFTYITNESGIDQPQCVICLEVLSHETMKRSKLFRHLTTKHLVLKDKSIECFRMAESARRQRLDRPGQNFTIETKKLHLRHIK